MKYLSICFAIFLTNSSSALNPNINPDSTRAVIERFNEAFNRHDVEGVMNMIESGWKFRQVVIIV
jgi:hypothetical protein